jgi:hypothetical protein
MPYQLPYPFYCDAAKGQRYIGTTVSSKLKLLENKWKAYRSGPENFKYLDTFNDSQQSSGSKEEEWKKQ